MENDNIEYVILEDQNGNEIKFEVLDVLEYNDREYAVMIPYEEKDEEYLEEEAKVYIYRLKQEKGEQIFEGIDDDTEIENVFEEFKIRTKDEYDFE